MRSPVLPRRAVKTEFISYVNALSTAVIDLHQKIAYSASSTICATMKEVGNSAPPSFVFPFGTSLSGN